MSVSLAGSDGRRRQQTRRGHEVPILFTLPPHCSVVQSNLFPEFRKQRERKRKSSSITFPRRFQSFLGDFYTKWTVCNSQEYRLNEGSNFSSPTMALCDLKPGTYPLWAHALNTLGGTLSGL